MPRPFPKKISQIKPTLTEVAQSSHFVVEFGGLSGELREHLKDRGMDSRFITDNLSLLCNRASLPGSGLATADVIGNFTGVAEKFAHTRTFVQMDMEFYVDNSYRSLKFIEHWMEFISSGSETSGEGVNPLRDGYHFRMRYPNEYKCDETRIIKFERDYKRYIEYRFFGLFPISLNATPVSYEGSTLLKASASFNYDRYYSGQSRSINEYIGDYNNKEQGSTSSYGNAQNSVYGFNSSSFLNTNDLGFSPNLSFSGNYANLFNVDPASTILNSGQISNAKFTSTSDAGGGSGGGGRQ